MTFYTIALILLYGATCALFLMYLSFIRYTEDVVGDVVKTLESMNRRIAELEQKERRPEGNRASKHGGQS